MQKELLEAIRLFTEEQAGRDASNITDETGLEKDLGIYGDDAVEYIIDFGKTFDVDVSQFMAADYFSPDGIFVFPSFRGKKTGKKKELTIHHLITAIAAGRLDEDIINS